MNLLVTYGFAAFCGLLVNKFQKSIHFEYLCTHFGDKSQIHMLTDNQLNHFQDNGFIIIDDLSERVIPQFLCDYIDELVAASRMKQASIGKAQFNQINTTERGDLIHWVDPKHCDSTIMTFLEHIEEIKLDLNRAFYMGLRDFECHLTQYPIGTYYKKHVDRHKNGSARRISVVYYLNPSWSIGDGGELIIYTNDQRIQVEPVFGRLALFLSELEHEVLPTSILRKSLTGWMLTEEII
jgi:SM-20-related protein